MSFGTPFLPHPPINPAYSSGSIGAGQPPILPVAIMGGGLYQHPGGLAMDPSLHSSTEQKSQQSNKGEPVWRCIQTVAGHTRPITAVCAVDGSCVATASEDCSIRVWDFASGKCIKSLEGHKEPVHCLALLPNGVLASGSEDATIKLWSYSTGDCLQTIEAHKSAVRALCATHDHHLLSGSRAYDETIKLWALEPSSAALPAKLVAILKGHAKLVVGFVQLSPTQFASASEDYTIKIWDLESAKCLRTLSGHLGWVNCIAVLKNGLIASGSHDHTIRIWNPATGECLEVLQAHADQVKCMCVMADGRLVSGSDDKTIRIWDIASSSSDISSSTTTAAPSSTSTDPSQTPDSTTSASSPTQPAPISRCVAALSGHAKSVLSLCALDDGKLVSGSADSSVKIWSLGVPSQAYG